MEPSKLLNLKYGTSLFCGCYALYGAEFVDWDPLTLRLQLKDDVGDGKREFPEASVQKLFAAIALRANDAFWADSGAFSAICNQLSRGMAYPDTFVPASVSDIAWGVFEAGLIAQPAPFDYPVAALVGLQLAEQGIYIPSKPLDFAIYPDNEDVAAKSATGGDPDMYRVFWQRQQEFADAVTGMLRTNCAQLVAELRGLDIPGADNGILDQIAVAARTL